MEHSISQVARMAGISARALRHYDEIGLLSPARVSANGYRWYGRRELLRLQRILLLKELRVPLPGIRDIVDGEADELTALRRHREQLVGERDRIDRILDTIDATIAGLSGERTISDEEFFAGFTADKERLREELVGRYGDAVRDHFAAAEQATAGWSREDHERAAADGRRLLTRMSEARAGGVAPDDDRALDLVVEHHRGVTALWPADATAYHALGDLLLDDPQQRAMVEDVDPQLPPWLADAIKAYAVHRLGHHLD
ncbi:MerR family transcriptional regulator [Blastococcus sp. TML/M2B]|uniref:MerR family transcriptional regulator n=1 Tax=unclassified Blastococcus TaxID=2619396 RepID=UPI00190E42A8|nr:MULTISPECIES: MerR family transcriptional regulator [unclassified Blastococcus]MBN1091966.1 MerR family transcriptional regulator [Blastococcus sp. TML/M2B]MBN1097930.1 MerR family transcriptional regulator [Blastococcus sp. TML/C7B]